MHDIYQLEASRLTDFLPRASSTIKRSLRGLYTYDETSGTVLQAARVYFVDKRIVIISKDPVFGGSVKVTYGIGLAIYWANLSQNKWW